MCIEIGLVREMPVRLQDRNDENRSKGNRFREEVATCSPVLLVTHPRSHVSLLMLH